MTGFSAPFAGASAGTGGSFTSGERLAVGMSLGNRYLIEAVLGEGGMGMVYRAQDRELGRTVALKVIRPELSSRPEILDRFKREILLASRVTHKNVVRIHDLGEFGDLRFISMSFVEGESLRALLDREGALAADRGVPIIRQIAVALQAAHEAGIVHRDLKPHNVLIDRAGEPYIGDFGISRSLDSEGTMTETGAILGTVDYMSPEQARGEVPDERSDIYSLGVMMFEMFTGSLPFRAANPLSVMVKRVHEDAPQPSVVRPGMPPWLSAIILRAMQRTVAARYQNVSELVRDLDRQRASRAARRRLGKRAIIAAASVLAAGLAIWGAVRFLQSRPASAVAVKTSLVVLPFRNATGDTRFDWVRTGATSVVRTGLLQARALRLAGDDRVQEVLGALKPGDGEEARPGTAQRIGKLAGVENVLAGSLLRIGDRFRIEASLMRVGDTTLAGTTPLVVDGANEAALPSMMDELTRKVRDGLGVAGGWGEKSAGAADLSTRSVAALSLYGEAIALSRAGNDLEAAKRLEETVAQDPQFGMAQALLAETYEGLGYSDKAKQAADRAAQAARDASPYESAYIRAVRARLAQDFDAAQKASEEICEITPNNPDAHFDLATVKEQRGDLSGALASFRRALTLDPNYPAAHYAVGRVMVKMGNTAEGLAELNTALDLHRAAGNEEAAATVLNGLGNAYDALGRPDEAARRFEEALAVRRRINDQRGVYVSLYNLSMIRTKQGRYEEAVRLASESIDTAQAIGYTSGVAGGYLRLGDIHQQAGRSEDAYRAYQESLKLVRELGDEGQLAYALSSIGYINTVLGRYVDAFFFLKDALARRRAIGDKGDIVRSLLDIGVVEQVQGRYDEALAYDAEALTLARELNERRLTGMVLANLSNIHEDQGNYAAALSVLKEALALAEELEDTPLRATIFVYEGSTRRRLGDLEGATAALEQAVTLARELNNPSLLAEALSLRGALLLDRNQPAAAKEAIKEARTAALRSGDRRLALIVRLAGERAAHSATSLQALLRDVGSSGLKPLLGPAHLLLARLHLDAGRKAAGLQELTLARTAATPLHQRDVLFQAGLLAARMSPASSGNQSALEQLRAALALLEEMRQGLPADLVTKLVARPESTDFAREAEQTFRSAGETGLLERLRLALTP